MANQSNRRKSAPKDSMLVSESSVEYPHPRIESGSSATSDPVVVGLGRILVVLVGLLLAGLVALASAFLSGNIEWDSPVMCLKPAGSPDGDVRQNRVRRVALSPAANVIRFDINRLNGEGLMRTADALRALSYEFCIPASEHLVEVVQRIDRTVQIQRHSPDRIGCGEAEYLAIGHTHQPDFESVLVRLSQLHFVESIEEAQFE